eukprot:14393051-Heterocapsa_arctica.AAC.1
MVTARARPDSFEAPKTSNNNCYRKLANFIYPYCTVRCCTVLYCARGRRGAAGASRPRGLLVV